MQLTRKVLIEKNIETLMYIALLRVFNSNIHDLDKKERIKKHISEICEIVNKSKECN